MTHPPAATATPWAALLAMLLAALLAGGCAHGPGDTPGRTGVPAAAPAPGLLDLMSRPAERALAEGMRAYDEAQYPAAEAALRKALDAGLASGRDRAGAHKLLAFITCSTQRVADCETAFRAARAADPGFALTRSEAGHPLWGPVYRRVLPADPAAAPASVKAAGPAGAVRGADHNSRP